MKRLIFSPAVWLSARNGTTRISTVISAGKGWKVAVAALACAETQTAQVPEPLTIRECG